MLLLRALLLLAVAGLASRAAACTDTWIDIAAGAARGAAPWAMSARTLDYTKLYVRRWPRPCLAPASP